MKPFQLLLDRWSFHVQKRITHKAGGRQTVGLSKALKNLPEAHFARKEIPAQEFLFCFGRFGESAHLLRLRGVDLEENVRELLNPFTAYNLEVLFHKDFFF